ncbi:hypothetical protein GALL_244690 [mine drainage metagenome]|uniref:Uncharacterized protein n=1 Tax=mine drainage metagenome TaxID=410659 RepID=A0A1J5RZV5_9ZZZZ
MAVNTPQGEKIELLPFARAWQCETVTQDKEMRIKRNQECIGRRDSPPPGLDKRPGPTRTECNTLSPEGDKGLLMQLLSQIGEGQFVRLKFQVKLVTQKDGDPQY